MNKISLLIGLSFVSIQLNAQIKFENDTTYQYYSFINRGIDSAFNLNADNEFEFRFAIVPPIIIPGLRLKLFRMTLNNGHWNARLLIDSAHGKAFTEIPIDSEYLSVLWKKLNQQQLLTILESYKLVLKNGEVASVHMIDAGSYYFELLSKNAKRSYWYYSPQASAEAFPRIKTFKQVSNIIKLISDYCHIKTYPRLEL